MTPLGLWTNWDGEIYFSHGESNAMGVCIMITTKLNHKVHNIHRSDSGRYLIIDITLNNTRMTLINVHAPNRDDSTFVTEIIESLEYFQNDNRVIG